MKLRVACSILAVACVLLVPGCSKDKKSNPVAPPDTPDDTTPPGAITDLIADAESLSVMLRWTAPGNDGATGRATAYEIHCGNTDLVSPTNWSSWPILPSPPVPHTAGTAESLRVQGLAPASQYIFCVRATDAAGNWAAASNLPIAQTTGYRTGPDLVVGLGDYPHARYSSNGGRTWQNCTLSGYSTTLPAAFGGFVRDPHDADVLYANAATGNEYGGGRAEIQRSTDRGHTWSPLGTSSAFLYGSGVRPLAASASVPGLLYATATGVCLEYPYNNCCDNCAGAIYRSTNGGFNWSDASGNLPVYPNAPFAGYHRPYGAIAVDPADGNHVYAAGQGWYYTGVDVGSVYVSANGGGTWTRCTTGLPTGYDVITAYTIAVSPGDGDRVLVSSNSGVYLTVNGGAGWSQVSAVTGTMPFVFDPLDPMKVYTTTLRSADGGQTWSPMPTPAGGRAAIAYDAVRQELYAAGTSGVYRSADEGATWSPILSATNCRAIGVLTSPAYEARAGAVMAGRASVSGRLRR
jgi:hypothetical protein